MTTTAAELGLRANPGARTEAYTLTGPALAVDDALLAFLKERLEQTGQNTVRVCLHDGPEAALHQMVIVHRRGGEFRPHKHLTKAESYHMIEGRLRIRLFDDQGSVTSETLPGRAWLRSTLAVSDPSRDLARDPPG